MIRALLLWLLCTAALAADLGEADAVRIGRERDLQGLRALISQRNQGLLFRAMNSWNLEEARQLPPALEALAVEHYADPVAQRPLIGQLGQKIDIKTHERYPKYASRKLFDLMYADLKAGREPHHYAIRIICTDLPVERELMALLPALPPAAANEIVMFLGARKYAPAVAALQALQARVPHESNTNQMIERVDWAYLQIGTPEAIASVLARLRLLGTMRDERAASEVWNILLYVNQLGPGRPPAFAELDAALPAQMNESSWAEVVKIIMTRKEKAGMARLLRAIAESPKPDDAVDALITLGEPADWRAGRTALERSRVPGERTTPLFGKLDAALSDPVRAYAQRDERSRALEGERSFQLYVEERRRISAFKATEPARYGAEMRKLLQSSEARLRGDELHRSYSLLAGFYRFTLRQPDEAIALYERASTLRASQSFDINAVALADTYRFDKRNPRKAIELYRRAAASLSPANAQDLRFAGALKRWIDAEVAYLENGRRFSGSIGPADVQSAFLWLGSVSMQDPIGPPAEAATLSRLAASQFQIARAMPSVFELSPGEMLPFFDKHDPAGYLTAAVFAFALAKEPSPYVKAAADTFFRTRGIHTAATAPANPRYATPEKTWSAFLAAAKKGDTAGVLDCFSSEMQAQLAPLFKSMPAGQLREMGASFVGFAMQGPNEAAIVRQDKDRRQAGFVTFVREGAGWKIGSI